MRIGFVTCVQLGLSCIEEILAFDGQLDLLITLEDDQAVSKSGRAYLDDVARENGIPLFKCSNINDPSVAKAITAASLDWLFIVGWSQIARAPVLSAPSRGALGMHPTLLPVGRGRASIPWAILKGLSETGVTLFQLDEGVDTGDILRQEVIHVGADETATSLYAKTIEAHLTLIREIWPILLADELRPTSQNHLLASEWPGRRPDDGRISQSMTLAEVERLVRATTKPYPGAFVETPDGVWTVWEGSANPLNAESSLPIALVDGTFYATKVEARASSRPRKAVGEPL